MNRVASPFVLLALLVLTGCSPRKEITSLQRKEAASLASEAEFAVTLRDYPRTEALLVKAVTLCPDTGDYWVNLASVRMRQRNRDGAKSAYRSALSAWEDAGKKDSKDTGPILHQIYILAALGRVDDARSLLEKATRKYPDDRAIQEFASGRELDALIADPRFKEIAL